MEELLGGGGKLQLLGDAAITGPVRLDLFYGRLAAVPELHENCRHVAVQAGHPEALGGDGGALGGDDLCVLHLAEELQGLLLALLLLAADVGDAVVHHLGPALKGLARAGDGLVGADQGGLQPVLAQGMQGGDVALEGAVGLHGDEAPLRAQTLALMGDHGQVLRVDLRHHHGDVLRPAVGGVVGDDGALQLGVALLQGPDLVFRHIHGAEAEIHQRGDLFRVRHGVHHHEIPGAGGDGGGHDPALLRRLAIGLPGAAGAGGDDGEAEPGVVLHQRDEALTHHARAADDADLVLFHAFLRFRPGDVESACIPGACVI